MPAHVGIPELGLDGVTLDPPLFDPAAFRLSDDETALAAKARAMGQAIFRRRARRRRSRSAGAGVFGSDWRAIAWDMPGYGGSPPLAAVSIAALAGALSRFLDQLGGVFLHGIGGNARAFTSQLRSARLHRRAARAP